MHNVRVARDRGGFAVLCHQTCGVSEIYKKTAYALRKNRLGRSLELF